MQPTFVVANAKLAAAFPPLCRVLTPPQPSTLLHCHTILKHCTSCHPKSMSFCLPTHSVVPSSEAQPLEPLLLTDGRLQAQPMNVPFSRSAQTIWPVGGVGRDHVWIRCAAWCRSGEKPPRYSALLNVLQVSAKRLETHFSDSNNCKNTSTIRAKPRP